MDRVELIGDEKEEKKVLHVKVEFQLLKMKEEVKQLKSLSYKNQESFFGCPKCLLVAQLD